MKTKLISLYKNKEILTELIEKLKKEIPNDTNEIKFVVSKISINDKCDLIFRRKKMNKEITKQQEDTILLRKNE